MKSVLVLAMTFTVALSFASQAHAAKACEELKTEIAAKLDGKGIKGYSLEIVTADKASEAKVVGTCDSGGKKITYTRK